MQSLEGTGSNPAWEPVLVLELYPIRFSLLVSMQTTLDYSLNMDLSCCGYFLSMPEGLYPPADT